MNVFLFGESNPTAQIFKNLFIKNNKGVKLNSCSRKRGNIYVDLENPSTYTNLNLNNNSVFISFAPIWVFTNFLKEVNLIDRNLFKKISSILVCSSSSVETKRFSFNKYDRILFYKLKSAEDNLSELCKLHKVQLKIIRPTLIYGNFGLFKDKNFNKIKFFLKTFPIIIFPKNSGLRQPIHCRELAKLFLNIFNNLKNLKYSEERILVGGDITLSYFDMIKEISNTIPEKLIFRDCKFILLPNRLFYFLVCPIFMFSPKLYESLLRISSDLSGFTPICQLLESKPKNRLLLND